MAKSGGSFDPSKTPGSFAAPPPGAPTAIADNSAAALAPTADQLNMARKYEQELAPLTYKDSLSPGKPLGLVGPDGRLLVPSAAVPITDPPAIPGTTEHPIIPPGGLPNTSSVKPVDGSLAALRRARLRPTIMPDTAKEPDHGDSGSRSASAGPAGDAADRVDHHGHDPSESPSAGDAEATAAPDSAPAGDEGRSDQPSGLAAAARRILTEKDLHSRPDPDQPYRPAESNTDSPSRGQPTAIADKGKQITGGFGDLGEAQYFPLDGSELRAVANSLLDQLKKRLLDDLRFSMAVVYPRVAVRALIEVHAYAQPSVEIQAVAPPHTKTPVEVAKDYGDEVVFVLTAQVTEMTDDGESITPPNQTRRDLGLEVPFKRMVRAGGATLVVDREPG